MNRKLIFSFSLILLFILTACSSRQIHNESTIITVPQIKIEETIKTNIDLVDNVFVYFSHKVGVITWDEAINYLADSNYKTSVIKPTENDIGRIKVYLEDKKDFTSLAFYPLNHEEKLSLLTYETYNGHIVINIDNNYHSTDSEYSIYNIDSDPKSKKVESLNELLNPLKGFKNESSETKTIDVYINTVYHKADGKIKIDLETNLPNETKLMLTIKKGDQSISQDNVIISGGKATSPGFSDEGYIFKKGTYSLEISMPILSVQTDNVRKILGNRGENLKGDLVIYSDFGECYEVAKNEYFNID